MKLFTLFRRQISIRKPGYKNNISDSAVAVGGYNLIQRDRKESVHCGVVKDSIAFTILEDLEDENSLLEVLSAAPNSTPKGHIKCYHWCCLPPSKSRQLCNTELCNKVFVVECNPSPFSLVQSFLYFIFSAS